MKSTQLTTCALGLLSLILLTQCAVVPTDPNAGSMRGGYGDYNYSGYNPSFQPYEAPARVSELSNGKYLVTINARVAAYDSSGRLMSSSGLSPNERYHADAAVESYREGASWRLPSSQSQLAHFQPAYRRPDRAPASRWQDR